jgi:hypothetical protein
MKFPKKLKVRLKRKDIRKGGYFCYNCPIQRAVSRKLGVEVLAQQRTVSLSTDEWRVLYEMDERTIQWLQAYDDYLNPPAEGFKPITMRLTRS